MKWAVLGLGCVLAGAGCADSTPVELEGEPFRADAVTTTVTRMAGGLLIEIAATDLGEEGTADDGMSIRVDLMLAEEGLAEGELRIGGTVSFGPWTDSGDENPTDEASFSPAPSGSPAILSAVAWASCFCTPAVRSAAQELSGTLELTGVSATRLEGRVTLTVTGALPFYRNGQDTEGARIHQLPFTAPIAAP